MHRGRLFVNKVGAGFPLVMLHGFPLDHRSMLPFEGYFSAHDRWQRYYIDLPGMGRSQDGFDVTSATDVLDGLTGFLEEEFAGRDFAVVGYSFGGLLASALAAAYGDRLKSLFLLAPEVVPEEGGRTLPPRVVHHVGALPADASDEEIDAYRFTAVVEGAENFAGFRRFLLPGLMENGDTDVFRHVAGKPSLARKPAEYLSQYRNPVTIVVGQDDSMVGYEDAFDLYRTLHDATYVALPKAGHNLHLDQPASVGCVFRRWLTDLDGNISAH